MKILTKNFSSLSSLNNLSLRCGRCQHIDDQTLENLSAGLKTLTKLSKISLAFPNCKEIGDLGVESIIYELGGLLDLKSVALDFKGCQPIQISHYNGIKMNKKIKSLKFDFEKLK